MGKKSRKSAKKDTAGKGNLHENINNGVAPGVSTGGGGAPPSASAGSQNVTENINTPAPPTSKAKPPIEPCRTALIHGLVNRSDLNNETVTIKKLLENGRVAVEVVRLEKTEFERREIVSIRPENLDMQWSCGEDGDMKNWGLDSEECPICMDTIITKRKTGYMDCCGATICEKCYVKIQFTPQSHLCPLCRGDTSDTGPDATLKKIKARANRGDANAMFNLGGFYDTGVCGLTQDQALAREWFKKAAEKGESRAAHNLACSYRDGEGGPVDRAQAAKYFRMAAEMGHVQSATNLGSALMGGDGVEKDLEEARMWLTKSANAGDEAAVQQLQFLEMMGAMNDISGWSFSTEPGVNRILLEEDSLVVK